ncbi:MAG: Uma2 family endonuclease [Anaerolineae bacterium]|nr:Uma2 family endonuclease [Anaerolineae bacterium]
MTISARDAHHRVLITLLARLQYWTTDGTLSNAPSIIALTDGEKAQPDIFWVSESNQRCQHLQEDLWQGAPDLVIEVVAPDTEAQDRGAKFHLYMAEQIFEYWIVNPVSKFIEVNVLLRGRYQRTGLFEAGESFSSGVFNGRVFDVNDLLGIRPEA